ncbi:MAG: hypothetical protein PHS93_09415 [Candidatus Omnitrophica bacterium]|nr:hypothetical protein [Candidatus Omnitrophota bacterium]MDD5353365.1 hypothetical protein [Candidatus Omnitrophota bacterium]
MNKVEYQERLKQITLSCEESKNRLYREYAEKNNPISVGMIIADHYHTIEVNEIKWIGPLSSNDSLPQCIYHGIERSKTGKPIKNGKPSHVYQRNLIKIVA